MAAVGVMDLLASLAPKHNQAISLKAQVVSEGVESSNPLQPVQALKSLYLISDRLRQTAFLDLDAEIFGRTEDAVSRMTQEAPDAALEIGEPVMQHEEAAGSPYVIGIAKGLSEIAIGNPRKLLGLTPSVVSIPVLFVAEPMIAIAYYDVTRSLPEAEEVSKELAEGLRYVTSEEGRRRTRNALLPKVSACGDSTVLRELLYDLPSEDVGVVLDHIEKATSGFSMDVVRQVVIAEISEQYSDIVREWGHGKRCWSFGIAAVVAASYPHSLPGLDDVLVYNHSDSGQALLLAAFIGSQNEYRFPEWLQDRLRSDPGVFKKLLVDGIEEVSEACAVVKRVLVEVPGIPLVLNDSLFDSVIRFRETQFGDAFVDTVMGRVVTEYVNEPAERQDFARWVDSTFGTEWFERVPYQRLLALLVQRGETTMSRWSQSWSVLRTAPDTLYTRRPPIIDDLVDHLLNIHLGEWTEKASCGWVIVIQRAGEIGTRHVHLTLCAQALDYSLRHPEMPLSKVVVETFRVVYRYTMKDSSSSWLGSLFYLFSDWDKGKELRQQVVKSFLKSDWPPEDLALAMPDQQTFRKIFKRVHRHASGERFIARMLAGLKISDDPKAAKMYKALSEMAESPDFDEPWI